MSPKPLLASGRVTEGELRQLIEEMSGDGFLDLGLTLIATWGYRPVA